MKDKKPIIGKEALAFSEVSSLKARGYDFCILPTLCWIVALSKRFERLAADHFGWFVDGQGNIVHLPNMISAEGIVKEMRERTKCFFVFGSCSSNGDEGWEVDQDFIPNFPDELGEGEGPDYTPEEIEAMEAMFLEDEQGSLDRWLQSKGGGIPGCG